MTTIAVELPQVKSQAVRMSLVDRAYAAMRELDRPTGYNRRELGQMAYRLATQVLGVKPSEIESVDARGRVTVEGLTLTATYDVERSHGADQSVIVLRLVYPCPKCGRDIQSSPIHDLADLARALEWRKGELCRECWR